MKTIYVCLKSDRNKKAIIVRRIFSLADGAVEVSPKIDNIGYWNMQELKIIKKEDGFKA